MSFSVGNVVSIYYKNTHLHNGIILNFVGIHHFRYLTVFKGLICIDIVPHLLVGKYTPQVQDLTLKKLYKIYE